MTERQSAFIAAFLADPRHNATKAAAAAGYAWSSRQGSRLRSYPEIAAAIRAEADRRIRELQERHREEREARLRAWAEEDERRWQAMPAWYRLGLPRPKGGKRARECRVK